MLTIFINYRRPGLHQGKKIGRGTGTRTRDTSLKRRVLYLLSYAPTLPFIISHAALFAHPWHMNCRKPYQLLS